MTQREICNQLLSQGILNIAQVQYEEQYDEKNKAQYGKSSLIEIKDFLNKICVLEPFSKMVDEKEMFRVTHISVEHDLEDGMKYKREYLNLNVLKKYNTHMFMTQHSNYVIVVNDKISFPGESMCPPSSSNVAYSMWKATYGNLSTLSPHAYESFSKYITKELVEYE
jgi:hypothetical protein